MSETNMLSVPGTKMEEKLAETAKQFLTDLIGRPLREVGLMATDSVRYWRFKNQVNIVIKTKKFLEEKGIQPQQVPLKTLVPLIENGSLEENENMQMKWAALLANAANPNTIYQIHSSYVKILGELSPLEAKLLDLLFDEVNKEGIEDKTSVQFSKEKICQGEGMRPEQFDLMVDNLSRLNLLQPPASRGGVKVGKYPIVMRTHDAIELTDLGYSFVKACRFS